jgi:undecaprenyl-diphosphatase
MTPLDRTKHLLRRLEPLSGILTALLVVSLLCLVLAHLASEVLEGETTSFDTFFLLHAQALRIAHPWIAGVMRDFSGVGSTAVLAIGTLAMVGYLFLASTRRTALFAGASVAVGAMANSLLKTGFGRVRPDPAFADSIASGFSFPSGHTSMSAIVFLTLGALFASTRPVRSEKYYILGVATVFTILVGISRVALGVHWATDVLGGWAFGAAWSILWLTMAQWSDRASARPQ